MESPSIISYLRRALESLSNETLLDDGVDLDDPITGNGNSTGNSTGTGDVNGNVYVYRSSSSSAREQTAFDPRVFWTVNVCLIVLFVGICLYCYYGDASWFTNIEQRRRESDAEYQGTLRDRDQRRKNAKILAPDKRRRLLLASFRRHKVYMTVEEKDLISENPVIVEDDDNNSNNNSNSNSNNNNRTNEEDPEASTTSFNNNGSLKLTTGALVPNCCAICLGDYEVGDQVVWSSNQACPHAFHQDCILDWLIKMQPETPCPCCRHEFTDWVKFSRERKIVWSGEAGAFNVQNVRF